MALKDSTNILKKIRKFMKNKTHFSKILSAYIVPSGDAHQSEYIAPADERRAFISGFTGSAGTAIITENKAVLYTDGRYFLQANNQLDSNWQLMKEGQVETPSQSDWLTQNTPEGGFVGVDPMLISQASWDNLDKSLRQQGRYLQAVDVNLVDMVWENKPNRLFNSIFALSQCFSGKHFNEKISEIHNTMKKTNAEILLISALDEIAYILNLRGADIEYNPVFFSYLIINDTTVNLFVNEQCLNDELRSELLAKDCNTNFHINILPYDQILISFNQMIEITKGKIWIDPSSSHKFFSLLDEDRVIVKPSPISLMKAIKNNQEIKGMKDSHVRDAVAVCEYLMWLENEINNSEITEISGSDYLESLRSKQDNYVGLSFATISSVGPHSAIIHYKATEESCVPITKDQIYLVDSGAQYLDGTTDITRTVHLGTPTELEKEKFTLVLKGHIALATSIFPPNIKGSRLDSFARASLWKMGLDYEHGTGHGVGSFLNVHEGPCSISYKPRIYESNLEPGMILSNEPGYYEAGKCGFRIESLVVIKETETTYNFKNKKFLCFETITLVPIQTKLINSKLLTTEEIDWINKYHEKCRDIIGKELKLQGKEKTLSWLIRETQPLG